MKVNPLCHSHKAIRLADTKLYNKQNHSVRLNMNTIQLFQNATIRRHWDASQEQWYFSVVDVVAVLTESVNPTDYLKKLRKREPELGTYLGTNCPQVAMLTNGVQRKTLAANVQAVLRLVQSIPSSKAEPFKQWLAKVGYERIQEISDPAQGLDRRWWGKFFCQYLPQLKKLK